jgi:serine/threonine protein kinase
MCDLSVDDHALMLLLLLPLLLLPPLPLLLPEGEAKGLFRQLLSAVAYLHDHWVLHRDLKVGHCYETCHNVVCYNMS